LVLANIPLYAFVAWCFILVPTKYVSTEIGPYNIHFSPYFVGLKSNILDFTRTPIRINFVETKTKH